MPPHNKLLQQCWCEEDGSIWTLSSCLLGAFGTLMSDTSARITTACNKFSNIYCTIPKRITQDIGQTTPHNSSWLQVLKSAPIYSLCWALLNSSEESCHATSLTHFILLWEIGKFLGHFLTYFCLSNNSFKTNNGCQSYFVYQWPELGYP